MAALSGFKLFSLKLLYASATQLTPSVVSTGLMLFLEYSIYFLRKIGLTISCSPSAVLILMKTAELLFSSASMSSWTTKSPLMLFRALFRVFYSSELDCQEWLRITLSAILASLRGSFSSRTTNNRSNLDKRLSGRPMFLAAGILQSQSPQMGFAAAITAHLAFSVA